MENYKIERILNGMKGKHWTYQKNEFCLKDFTIGGNVVKLYCDGADPITILREDFDEIINGFYPIDTPASVLPKSQKEEGNKYLAQQQNNQMPVPMIFSNADTFNVLIMENIKGIKENKDFIPQAVAVNDQIKTLIDISKAQIEMMRLQLALTKA